MEGSILAPGGAVRIRPLDGGGNETQVEAPQSGQLVARGLENGNYEAVDEAGNSRVFTVTGGPGEEVVLEDFGDAEAVEPAPLDPLHGTEAAPVPDQSHQIQHGITPLVVGESDLTLSRAEPVDVGETAPPTIPGPANPATTPGEPAVSPGAVVTEETVGNSSDAVAPTPEEAQVPAESIAPVAGDGAGNPPATAPGEPSPAAEGAGSPDPIRQSLEAFSLDTGQLVAVLDRNTAEFPDADKVDEGAAVDELRQRAEQGNDAAAQAALERHGLLGPGSDPEHPQG